MRHVYVGNVHLPAWNNARCPACDEVVIERRGYRVTCRLTEAACPGCGAGLPIVLGQSG
jgi:predicted RNA-binding Zn-ribbon protein involved in translation (DUF1610 family)